MKANEIQNLTTPLRAYGVDKVLGEGGAGVVFKVHDDEGKSLAAKVLRPGATTLAKKRFQNELFYCLRNDHKNVVKVLDYGDIGVEGERTPFYVMPYFPHTLRGAMKAELSPADSMSLFCGVLDGIEAAHLKGVWHRDLKPENILVDADKKTAVVSDFGIAHFAEAELETAVRTKAADKLANFRYASPEQLHLQLTTPATDIFALGLLLNELLTGRVPSGVGFRTIGEVHPDWAPLDALVTQMRQEDPIKRPPIQEIKRELSRITTHVVAQQALALDAKKVVPAAEALIPEPIRIHSYDWSRGTLRVNWDKKADGRWVEVFKNGSYNHGELGGLGPEHADVGLTSASIRAQENEAQAMLNLMHSWVQGTNGKLEELLRANAARKERQEQEEHDKRMRAEEIRVRVLSGLKLPS